MKNLSNLEIVNLAKKGSNEALNHIYKENRAMVNKVVTNLIYGTRQYNFKDDIVQDIFIKIFSNIDKFKEDTNFKGWIAFITKNHVLDILRKEQKITPVSITGMKSSINGETFEFQVEDTSSNIEENAIKEEKMAVLHNLITSDDFKDKVREIANLRYIEGFKYEEIAEMASLPLNTVKSILHNVKLKLKNKIDNNSFIHEMVS